MFLYLLFCHGILLVCGWEADDAFHFVTFDGFVLHEVVRKTVEGFAVVFEDGCGRRKGFADQLVDFFVDELGFCFRVVLVFGDFAAEEDHF